MVFNAGCIEISWGTLPNTCVWVPPSEIGFKWSEVWVGELSSSPGDSDAAENDCSRCTCFHCAKLPPWQSFPPSACSSHQGSSEELLSSKPDLDSQTRCSGAEAQGSACFKRASLACFGTSHVYFLAFLFACLLTYPPQGLCLFNSFW